MQLRLTISTLLIATAATAQVGTFTVSDSGCPNAGTTAATDIGAGDDSVTGPLDLMFSFPYAGGLGSTTSIDVSSNGYIYLESGTITSPRCCSGISLTTGAPIASFLVDTPSIACFGQDLNANPASSSGGGSIHFETNGVDQATITWDGVGEFGNPGASNTLVCTLFASGNIQLEWNNCALLTHGGLVGYSPGGGATDLGSVDLSAAAGQVSPPGAAVYEGFVPGTFDLSNTSLLLIPSGAGGYIVTPGPTPPPRDPMTLSSGTVPTIGSSFDFQIDNIPSLAVATAAVFGELAVGPIALPGAPGCEVSQNANLGSIFALGDTVSFPIPLNAAIIGAVLETQGVSIAPSVNPLGIVTSDRGTITIGDVLTGVEFTADGTNSFNSITTAGFWKLTNNSGQDITSLKVDFSVNLAGKEFDTDQTAMADRFDGGNSTTPLCFGTYRNGCDATTGLVYSGTPAAGCDPGANTGWTGSNPLGTVGDFATIDFTFSDFNDGEVFEFDCDTDGAGGISGDAMAGTVITVTLADGTVLSGTLAVSGAASATVNL